jgi:hypothetical protein
MEQLVKEFISMANKYAMYRELYGTLCARVNCLQEFCKNEKYLAVEDISRIMEFDIEENSKENSEE